MLLPASEGKNSKKKAKGRGSKLQRLRALASKSSVGDEDVPPPKTKGKRAKKDSVAIEPEPSKKPAARKPKSPKPAPATDEPKKSSSKPKGKENGKGKGKGAPKGAKAKAEKCGTPKAANKKGRKRANNPEPTTPSPKKAAKKAAAKRRAAAPPPAEVPDRKLVRSFASLLEQVGQVSYEDSGLDLHLQKYNKQGIRLNVYWGRNAVGITVKTPGLKGKDVAYFSTPTPTIATHLQAAQWTASCLMLALGYLCQCSWPWYCLGFSCVCYSSSQAEKLVDDHAYLESDDGERYLNTMKVSLQAACEAYWNSNS